MISTAMVLGFGLAALDGAMTRWTGPPQQPPPPELAGRPSPKGIPRHWISVEGYPAAARAGKLQGQTRYEVRVDHEGRALGCRVVASSGHAILDKATCRRVMAHAEFYGAQDRAGRPISGVFTGRYTWRLPGARRR